MEDLSGLIERVTFHNPDSGFAVLKVKIRDRRELATVVGSLSTVTEGEQIEARGQWVVDRQHGAQFQADQLTTTHPASIAGIQRYLASGAIRSIGPQLAARIVDVHQQQTLEILDRAPDMLLHIHGIGAKRLSRIKESWQEQKEVRRIMLFLQECGVGSGGRAVRIYRAYGSAAINRIRENPYQLADDIRGIGFKTADELAARLGMDRNSPQRARAAIRYALGELSQQGHCAYPEKGLVRQTESLVGMTGERIQAATDQEVAAGKLVRDQIEGESWIYLAALYRSETGIAQVVNRLTSDGRHPLKEIKVEAAIQWVQQRVGFELAAQQQEAIRQVCRYKFVIVTGGPGVGKTTLVRSLVEIFAAKKLDCVLAAPTGRAAKRLAETTGRPAKTIHRLLEFDPATGQFKRTQSRPLSGDLFVLDEASMVDVVLGYRYLRAIPATACVVLVGDVDQLPSVGPGAVLGDLIDSSRAPVVRLTEVFRQSGRSRIITAANQVNVGRLPDLSQADELSDFYFVDLQQPEAIQDMIVKLVQERIPDRFGYDPLRDVQVLTPMHRSLLGARQLNEVLQEALNPLQERSQVQRYGSSFRVHDRVIQTENNYDRDVFNGDLGVVQSINRVEQELVVSLDGREVTYDFADLDELSLAYALSIHKSQGSEYPCVVIPIHTQHYVMLQRNLLYTAMTRGKRLVVLVGSSRALAIAVRRADTSRRYSALAKRLCMTSTKVN